MNPSSLESASPQELVYRRLRLFFGNAICTLVAEFARIREPIPLELLRVRLRLEIRLMEKLSSEELMLKCKHGENRAFDILMKRHEKGLIRFFKERLLDNERPSYGEKKRRDRVRAEDLTQETFLRAFNARTRYVPKAKFTTWLYHIALNLYRDEIRRTIRHQTISLSQELTYETSEGQEETYELHEAIPDASILSPQEVLEQEEQESLLKAAIDSLTSKHRDILILRYYNELDYEETAQRLGCSIGTVKSRLYYASQALKRKIKSEKSCSSEGTVCG